MLAAITDYAGDVIFGNVTQRRTDRKCNESGIYAQRIFYCRSYRLAAEHDFPVDGMVPKLLRNFVRGKSGPSA